ncbi:MAG: energy transducer TonB [Brevundimonas sp.]|uniref:energy transducer TonB n=1 Tax=Brevundimonas sp. TaxID=1871086 RepID=UPI002733F936|nr:energy transducer TonB [Brevundimonas sp.]MDP3379141.1 energy transducer TonB [Brevundimonas sp.]
MMMNHAGGPGLVSPLDYGETPRWKLTPTTLTAVAIVLAAHVGVGIALYYQRFELPVSAPSAPDSTIKLEFYTRPPPVLEVAPEPPAPNPPIHRPTLTVPTTETLTVVIPDVPTPTTGAAITLTRPIPNPSPEGTGTTPTEAVPAGPPTITNPDWVRKPTGEALMRAYPERAIQANVTGSATLSCTVRVNGSLTDCQVVSETPGGYGFGRAATRLSRDFRMSPRTVDGQAVGGARVTVGIRFTLPEN